MMLRSRIFETKKRLSSLRAHQVLVGLGILSFFMIFTLIVRVFALDSPYGRIVAEFPVLSVNVKDPTYHRFSEKPKKRLSKYTAVVVMTDKEFFFGDVQAFTTELQDVRTKFAIPHVDGVPQVGTLADEMLKWFKRREDKELIRRDGIVVLVPDGRIPMAIVMQVMDQIRREKVSERIVLGATLI